MVNGYLVLECKFLSSNSWTKNTTLLLYSVRHQVNKQHMQNQMQFRNQCFQEDKMSTENIMWTLSSFSSDKIFLKKQFILSISVFVCPSFIACLHIKQGVWRLKREYSHVGCFQMFCISLPWPRPVGWEQRVLTSAVDSRQQNCPLKHKSRKHRLSICMEVFMALSILLSRLMVSGCNNAKAKERVEQFDLWQERVRAPSWHPGWYRLSVCANVLLLIKFLASALYLSISLSLHNRELKIPGKVSFWKHPFNNTLY